MHKFGIWILLTFGIYYFLALVTKSKNVVGAMILGAILALEIVLVI